MSAFGDAALTHRRSPIAIEAEFVFMELGLSGGQRKELVASLLWPRILDSCCIMHVHPSASDTALSSMLGDDAIDPVTSWRVNIVPQSTCACFARECP